MENLRKNTLLKVLSLNSISVAVSFVLGVFSSKIISIFLGTSGMALMGSFRNFTQMIKSIATLGISNSIVKLFVENKNDKKELSVIYSTFFWIFLMISGILVLLIFLFSGPISSFLFYTEDFVNPIRLFGLFLPFIVINTFWLAIYNGLEKFKKIIIIQIISNCIVFGITAMLIWKGTIAGGLFSIAVTEIIMLVVTFFFVRNEDDYFRFDLQKVISPKYVQVIKRFSAMALLSAVIVPLTLLLIRNEIVHSYSIHDAGIWDAVNRLSGFYMMFFNSGLSLYYLPKLSSIHTDREFKTELKSYFKIFVPLFLLMLVVIYLAREIILAVAFTNEFSVVKDVLIWQLAGDFIKILTLAFGYQILVKTMMKRYLLGEIAFNVSYFLLSLNLMKFNSVEGVVQSYFYANLICLILILVMFRKIFFKPSAN